VSSSTIELDEADLHRVQAYMLLSSLLARPPTAPLLERLSSLRGNASPLGQALTELGEQARTTTATDAEHEFNRLFIGLQRGEVVPYASFYLTGFLQDRPLVNLRAEMSSLGLVRSPGVPEPEDHIAAIAEIMAGLIDGRFGTPATTSDQHRFFTRHIDAWAPKFFEDLEHAEGAVLYRPLGTFGRLFLDIERDAFALTEA